MTISAPPQQPVEPIMTQALQDLHQSLGRQHGLQGDDMEALAARLEGCTQRVATEPAACKATKNKPN